MKQIKSFKEKLSNSPTKWELMKSEPLFPFKIVKATSKADFIRTDGTQIGIYTDSKSFGSWRFINIPSNYALLGDIFVPDASKNPYDFGYRDILMIYDDPEFCSKPTDFIIIFRNDGSSWLNLSILRPYHSNNQYQAASVIAQGYSWRSVASNPELLNIYRCVNIDYLKKLSATTISQTFIWDDYGSGAWQNVSIRKMKDYSLFFAYDYYGSPQSNVPNIYSPLTLKNRYDCCNGTNTTNDCNVYTQNSGFCDNFMVDYCNDPINKDDPKCSCINSTIAFPFVARCNDKNCIVNGYLTRNMQSLQCPDITQINCTQYLSLSDIQKSAIVDRVTFDQKCGTGGTDNNNNNTNNTDNNNNNNNNTNNNNTDNNTDNNNDEKTIYEKIKEHKNIIILIFLISVIITLAIIRRKR